MVQRHSAELEIDSFIDKGTTFRMIFPSAAPDTIAAVHVPAPARPADAVSAVTMRHVSPQSPELEHRLKPLLNRGTNMDSAAEGFKDWRDFATIAHASHNTQVPFVVLKHHVLNEGRTLESVISEFKPNLDAKSEASRAREEASQDLAWPR